MNPVVGPLVSVSPWETDSEPVLLAIPQIPISRRSGPSERKREREKKRRNDSPSCIIPSPHLVVNCSIRPTVSGRRATARDWVGSESTQGPLSGPPLCPHHKMGYTARRKFSPLAQGKKTYRHYHTPRLAVQLVHHTVYWKKRPSYPKPLPFQEWFLWE